MKNLHIFTYDIRGTRVATETVKFARQTGLVTQTHHLLQGIINHQPSIKLAVTQTGARKPYRCQLRIPEGRTVFAQGLSTGFPEYLDKTKSGGKDKELVDYYYEDSINDEGNPIYQSLAKQYTEAIYNAGIRHLILQNANPTVSLLKAEELNHLDAFTAAHLNAVSVIHDTEGYAERLKYIQRRQYKTRINLKFIAISNPVKEALIDLGFKSKDVTVVPNGVDLVQFKELLKRSNQSGAFTKLAQRNRLPLDKKMILVSARRVEHKGHFDVIEATKVLKDRNEFEDFFVAFTGRNMLNTQALNFEKELELAIKEAGLENDIFLLDDLSSEEVAACFDKAYLSVLASTEPEGFAYANIESMLAGTPVITTRIGGPLDYIIHGQTGMFVEPRKPSEIAETISKLNSNPDLYSNIVQKGRLQAENYSLNHMAKGYLNAINKNASSLSNPSTIPQLRKVGEGMHTEVYCHHPCNGLVVQVLKKEHELSVADLTQEFEYLKEAYSSMPHLIPEQKTVVLEETGLVDDILFVKERVYPRSDLSLLSSPVNLFPKTTLREIEQFLRITKELFNRTSQQTSLRYLGSRVPDIIDPELNNLVVDRDNRLRLIDTNKIISTRHLTQLATEGKKLDTKNKKIHTLLLGRLLLLEYKFLQKDILQFQQDDFYQQYLTKEDISILYSKAKDTNVRKIS